MNHVDARLVPELVERFGALRKAADSAFEALGANAGAPVNLKVFAQAQSDAVTILREIVAMQDGEARDEQPSADVRDQS